MLIYAKHKLQSSLYEIVVNFGSNTKQIHNLDSILQINENICMRTFKIYIHFT